MSEEWKKIRPEKLFVVFGFALMAVSAFLPFIAAQSIGINISRTGLEFSPEVGYLSLLFFAIGSLTVWFYDNYKRAGIICLLMSIWMLVETLVLYPQLQDRVSSFSTSLVLVSIGSGFYLLAIGTVLSIIGSIQVLRAQKPQRPESPQPPVEPNISQENLGGDIAGRLEKLKGLLDSNLITKEEYEKRKKEILSQI